jgi:hypothetical protein
VFGVADAEVCDECAGEVEGQPDGGGDSERFALAAEQDADGPGEFECGEGGKVVFGETDGAADDGADVYRSAAECTERRLGAPRLTSAQWRTYDLRVEMIGDVAAADRVFLDAPGASFPSSSSRVAHLWEDCPWRVAARGLRALGRGGADQLTRRVRARPMRV